MKVDISEKLARARHQHTSNLYADKPWDDLTLDARQSAISSAYTARAHLASRFCAAILNGARIADKENAAEIAMREADKLLFKLIEMEDEVCEKLKQDVSQVNSKVNINVNGTNHLVDTQVISYLDIVRLAFQGFETDTATVTWRRNNSDGILLRGQAIFPIPGTIFSVFTADKA